MTEPSVLMSVREIEREMTAAGEFDYGKQFIVDQGIRHRAALLEHVRRLVGALKPILPEAELSIKHDGPGAANFTNLMLTVGDCYAVVEALSATGMGDA